MFFFFETNGELMFSFERNIDETGNMCFFLFPVKNGGDLINQPELTNGNDCDVRSQYN